MPAVVEPGSAASRIRFREPVADSEAEDVGGNSDREVVAGGLPAQRFELQEDPSFWKDHNVQVVIRIRPLSSAEISLQGHNRCVRQDSCQTITWTGHPESRFTFDLIADEHITQEKLFKVAGVPMVENCVAGYNSCMFAYGQTGSGKTHTMLGDIEGGTRRHSVNCGMTPRVFEYLFSRIQKEKEARRDEKLRFTCKCSFLEIYNEQILDLLNPNSVNLQIREDLRKGVHVESLSEFEVSCARDVMQHLVQGSTNRKVAATNMNRASSRSHSVFTCVIESKWEVQGVNHHRFARLNLVDLAGSERQKSSGAEGDRLKEATNINKSLSTLGLVIMNLVSISNKKSLHVPYRDSKLTFLLQDSLGGNSKTTIIANISPSNCCTLETLSTLKFAQRAKYIRNNAIINEDASGDVLSMRLQIQQLKKEVNRLRGLGNIGTDNAESDSLNACLPGTPASFKWDGDQGSFSPLTIDKRLSQRKEYEAALVAAFRRDKDKEAALKALTAEKQTAEELATQRTEEVRSLKMRLRFREEHIKRLEAVASGKLSAETHLIQEKECLLKEIDVLRNQVDRNPEVTRFAMENLQLKEELRRLQSFVQEGEREMMNEQITVLQDKLLEALDWRLMHEKDTNLIQNLSSSWDAFGNEENEFLRLQAIQNQREIEALRRNLSSCLEAKEKLERSEESNHEFHYSEIRDIENLEHQLREMHEENEKLMGLYENAMKEKDNLKRILASVECATSTAKEESLCPQKSVELEEEMDCQNQENESLTEHLAEVPENAVKERDDLKRILASMECATSTTKEGISPQKSVELEEEMDCQNQENESLTEHLAEVPEKMPETILALVESLTSLANEENLYPQNLVEMDEEMGCENQEIELPDKMADIVRNSLELVQDKLTSVSMTVKYFGMLESNLTEFNELSDIAKEVDHDIKFKQQEVMELKLIQSQLKERKTVLDKKFLALKSALLSFSSKANYWEEREARARTRLNVCSEHVEPKKEELRCLKTHKDEIYTAVLKAKHSESQLRHNIDGLKSKLHDAETRRQKTERVLFAIDNMDNADISMQKTMNFGKASELLKSEEERSKLSAEIKKFQEQLAIIKKETASLVKKAEAIDTKIKATEAGLGSGLQSLQQAEVGLQQVIDEQNMLCEMREDGMSELGKLLLELQDCIFGLDLKEGEILLCEEIMQQDLRKLDDVKSKHDLTKQKLNQLLNNNRCPMLSDIKDCSCNVSEKLEEELSSIQMYLDEVITNC
ncbi:hypothetical protein Cni_G04320 [Canna indica]|uniref:Kinesin motor domain-containing protein n=1 Tax=Canna indica TaxID=4628 RepID=A0AAQ3JSJ6_9LILI|nr:hypothetical protein Cni_G04320 [Canna indica]